MAVRWIAPDTRLGYSGVAVRIHTGVPLFVGRGGT